MESAEEVIITELIGLWNCPDIFMIHRIEENLKNSTGLEGKSQDLGSSLNFMSPITASTSFHPSEHKVHHL